ncbi:P-type conjugative transfer protein TrbG [Prosthecochloris sp. HL-130-GSB]|uniref:P-type conjugative transfer protein TrbG n=1 Tax=Prosthecochloris sp. HL-130-GSB TaxID=1974213 RepID=UPI000A1C041C|nr:P-type conjugative transfer protein TrbG [Prosthecochloris sp. HL-130-GSB]ARM30498.1 P-type conjugative transfer protein TrbG [Prosthecochloris sp. HL-130-GSB]
MKSRVLLSGLLLCSLGGLGGCGASASGTFVEANRQPGHDEGVAPLRQPSPLAVNRRLPVPERPPQIADDRSRPWEVIEQANSSSAQNPDGAGYFNAIMQYDYVPGSLFQVYAAPLRLTDIQLQPGERIVGQPAAGDTVRWVLGIGRSRVDGVEQQHIYVKPTRPGLETTLVITTDRRTYHIELHSYRETYMAAVNWRYPHEELAIAGGGDVVASQVDLSGLNFAYEVDVHKGRRPDWLPLKVFDDGRKTFIQFPDAMLSGEAPVLFVVSRDGETQLVNYRVKDEFFVVDRLFEMAELRVGTKRQNVVRISRL